MIEKNKKTLALAAKVSAGLTFLFVLLLNMTSLINKDSKATTTTLSTLNALAQGGGESGYQMGYSSGYTYTVNCGETLFERYLYYDSRGLYEGEIVGEYIYRNGVLVSSWGITTQWFTNGNFYADDYRTVTDCTPGSMYQNCIVADPCS